MDEGIQALERTCNPMNIRLVSVRECGRGAKLQRGDRLFQRAADSHYVRARTGTIVIGGGSGSDLEKELVAGPIGKTSVVAVDVGVSRGNRVTLTPLHGNAGKKGCSTGYGPAGIRRFHKRAARFLGHGRVHGELKMPAGESGVGVGIIGDHDRGDKDGAGLLGFQLLLGPERGRIVRFDLFLKQVIPRIAERDAVGRIAVSGEHGIPGRMLCCGRR